jgi:hypothetical protein
MDEALNMHRSVLEKAKRAVVQVGYGRGFVVGTPSERFIVTAAHCLPRSRYPRPHLANGTLPRIIGPLGSKRAHPRSADRHRPAENDSPAWLLSLDGQWQSCTVQNNGRFLLVRQGYQLIRSGMSGSCILNESGGAIGLMSTSGSTDDMNSHPSLTDCLPSWLLRLIKATRRFSSEP